jgi:hypothetical protein
MNLKRSICTSAFLLLSVLLASACGTLQVGLESTATPMPAARDVTPVKATQTPMPRSPTATPTGSASATPTPVPPPTADVAPGWETYNSERFVVTFRYPSGWQLDPVHGGERYAGEDGYFILDAIGSEGAAIDAVAANQARHHLLPFGSNPTIERLEVQGQEARLILPSADATMGDQALLIARYPEPVTILGAAYDHFALYVDQAHIRTIAQTLQFASPVDSEQPAPSP